MGKTKEEVSEGFGGFASVFSTLGHEDKTQSSIDLTSNTIQHNDDDDDNAEPIDLSLGKTKQNDNVDPDKAEATSSKEEEDDSKPFEGQDELLKSTNNKNATKTDDDDSQESTDNENETTEGETQQIHSFFDALAESLGWDSDEDTKPNNVEEFIDYMQKVVEENSKPSYANEEIEALNDFVKNGGNIEDYIASANELKDYKTIDISDESNQKRILREYLAYTGLNETQINRKISKYDDAGLLEDEAEEALEYLQEIKAEEQQQLLVEQQKQAAAVKEQQQAFYKNVVNEIDGLKDIRGINIPKEDKKELQQYLFKVEADGKTKYQKDYSKSVKNLIESAYFTMKGDALLNSAKKSGETSAVKKLKQTLNSTKVGGSKHGMSDDKPAPVWSIGSFLRQPTN